MSCQARTTAAPGRHHPRCSWCAGLRAHRKWQLQVRPIRFPSQSSMTSTPGTKLPTSSLITSRSPASTALAAAGRRVRRPHRYRAARQRNLARASPKRFDRHMESLGKHIPNNSSACYRARDSRCERLLGRSHRRKRTRGSTKARAFDG